MKTTSTEITLSRKSIREIAQELFRIMKDDKDRKEPLMTTDEAIIFTSMPRGTFSQKIKEIPHTKVGKRNYFRKSDLVNYMER